MSPVPDCGPWSDRCVRCEEPRWLAVPGEEEEANGQAAGGTEVAGWRRGSETGDGGGLDRAEPGRKELETLPKGQEGLRPEFRLVHLLAGWL